MIRRRRRAQLVIPEISLTPLIDTALTLLIIFMVATPMMKSTIRVDLPESASMEKTQTHPDSIEVVIDAQRQLFVNNTAMSATQLQRYIEAHIASVPDHAVFLSGDKKVQFQEIVRVFDLLKSIAGVQHVALLTTKAE
ncbi:biopolymer transporter ExbD [Candidatus Dependentiae bacterium]|nr:biopolymer transporter ExbD [Candidatus Dependentiae bacterium]